MKKRGLTTDDALRMMKKIGTGGGGGIEQETDPTVPSWAKQPTKPTYTAAEVGALPSTTKIPAKTSDLTNDSGFISGIPSEYVTETELTNKGYVTSNHSHSGYVDLTTAQTITGAKTFNSSNVFKEIN